VLIARLSAPVLGKFFRLSRMALKIEEWHRVPIDPDYDTCEETRAKLLIYPTDLLHEQVTKLIGIQPTQAHNKGDCHKSSYGKISVAPLTLWCLSSEGIISSRDLRDHLNWLLDRVEPAKSELFRLRSEHRGSMRFDCIWWSKFGQGGPTLWPEQMRRIADLDIECGFDISFFGEDEEPRLTIS
jgi:uncharacterized protein DUF4279